jgi:ubiquinone/menaquinone biosynthesis C-methylase UbiE
MANGAELRRLRADALTKAQGRVLEIGFGTGASLPHYPGSVSIVVALDPNPGMHDRAASRIRQARVRVAAMVGEAERIPLADATIDTVVSMLTLCTVSDPVRVLGELRRVLRKDGRLIVIEHGLSDDPGVARWQHRLNRIQNAIACGCNLDRAVASMVEGSGFVWDDVQRFYAPGIPRTHGWITTGVARPLLGGDATRRG